MPDIKESKFLVFETISEGVQISLKKAQKTIEEDEDSTELTIKHSDKYENKLCKWCNASLPSNGAAQFSHLKRHINQLVKHQNLSSEQAGAIHSIKLTPEMEVIFLLAKSKKIFL